MNAYMLVSPDNESFKFAMSVEWMPSFTNKILLRHFPYDIDGVFTNGFELLNEPL